MQVTPTPPITFPVDDLMGEIITSTAITPEQKVLHGLRLVARIADLGHVEDGDRFLDQMLSELEFVSVHPSVVAQVYAAKARTAAFMNDRSSARIAAHHAIELLRTPDDAESLLAFIDAYMLLGDLDMLEHRPLLAAEKYQIAAQVASSSFFPVDGLRYLINPIFALTDVYYYMGEFSKGAAILAQGEAIIDNQSQSCVAEKDIYRFRIFALKAYGASLSGSKAASADAEHAVKLYSRIKWNRPKEFLPDVVSGLVHLGYYFFNTEKYLASSLYRKDALIIAEGEAGIGKSGAAKLYYDYGLSELFALVNDLKPAQCMCKIESLFREAVRYQAEEGLTQTQEYADYCFAYGSACLLNGHGFEALPNLREAAGIEKKIWGDAAQIMRPNYLALSLAYEILGQPKETGEMIAAAQCYSKTFEYAGAPEDFRWRALQKKRILDGVFKRIYETREHHAKVALKP